MPASCSNASCFLDHDRVVVHVARGHNEQPIESACDQMLQRRCGQHDAKLGQVARKIKR